MHPGDDQPCRPPSRRLAFRSERPRRNGPAPIRLPYFPSAPDLVASGTRRRKPCGPGAGSAAASPWCHLRGCEAAAEPPMSAFRPALRRSGRVKARTGASPAPPGAGPGLRGMVPLAGPRLHLRHHPPQRNARAVPVRSCVGARGIRQAGLDRPVPSPRLAAALARPAPHPGIKGKMPSQGQRKGKASAGRAKADALRAR